MLVLILTVERYQSQSEEVVKRCNVTRQVKQLLMTYLIYTSSANILFMYIHAACGKMRVNLRWQGGAPTQFFGQPLRPFGEKQRLFGPCLFEL